MEWIKRNLGFVIGSVMALLLMGLAGFYLYTKWSLNNSIVSQLDEQYAELDRLNKLNPHPGEPGKTDNVEEAKNQQKQLRDALGKSRTHFERIAPIPDMAKISDADFSRALSRTIDQMQKEATSASVGLPPKTASGGNYAFSFEAQRNRVSFAPGSLTNLSVQLGEVKAICDVIFQAKINSLDSLRRETVSSDDVGSPQAQTDYISRHSATNELAVLSPYEITMRCFSSELAAVVAGFASSPYGLVVKTISVEPGPSAVPEETPTMVAAPPIAPPVAPQPSRTPTAEAERAMRDRYGSMGPRGEGGRPTRYQPPAPAQPTPAPAPAPATGRGGLPTVLDEKQLKVTLTVDVVKLLPTATK